MLPDLLAVQIRIESDKSEEGEIHALFSAVHFLEGSQDVPTVFHTDCKTLAEAINSKTRFGKKHPRQSHMLEDLKRFFHGGCWTLRWVARQKNKVADYFSKFKNVARYAQRINDRGFFQVYSLNLSESEFRRENGEQKDISRVMEVLKSKTPNTLKPVRVELAAKITKRAPVTSISEYLQPCVWLQRKTVDQIFAYA